MRYCPGSRWLAAVTLGWAVLTVACNRPRPTPVATVEDHLRADADRLFEQLVGTWHRDKPIDYDRPLNAIEIRRCGPSELHSTDRPLARPLSPLGSITRTQGGWVGYPSFSSFGKFRLEWRTMQIDKLVGPSGSERVDWPILELTAERLVVREPDGQSVTYFRVDASELNREQMRRRK